MAEDKKKGVPNQCHDQFEEGSTTSDKTSFAEGSRRPDPPRTGTKPAVKPKPKIQKKIRSNVPQVDVHGKERTREIPAGQVRNTTHY